MPTRHTPRVYPGDIIDGSAAGSLCTSAGRVHVDELDQGPSHSTVLDPRAAESNPMKWVATALDVYYLASCSELPSSGGEAFTINVPNAHGSWSVVPWTKSRSSALAHGRRELQLQRGGRRRRPHLPELEPLTGTRGSGAAVASLSTPRPPPRS
jgi:hypothetical protein